MEDELGLLKDAMQGSRVEQSGNFEFVLGTLAGKPVVLLRCGIGKVNAAVGCALLIERYHPAMVINTGSAGGIDSSLHVGDAIVSEGLMQYDVDVTGFGYAPGQIPKMPLIFPVPAGLVEQGERAVDELKLEGRLPAGFSHRRGIIGSGDIFMDNEERIAALRRQFPQIRAVEMEGAAIAQCCYILGTPFLIIRALSDIAGTESPVKSEEFLPLASKHSAEIVMRIVRNID
jgi:adenosylhomocysteine nucleosidase